MYDTFQSSFKKLCDNSDKLLINHGNIETVSISWLHVLRDHTEFTKKYISYTSKRNYLSLFLRMTLLITKNFTSAFINLGKAFFSRNSNKEINLTDKKYIFLSHCLTANDFYNTNDFYFDELPYRINDPNNIVIVLFNWSGIELDRKEHSDSIERYFLKTRLGAMDEFKIFASQLRNFISLIVFLYKNNFDLRFVLNFLPEIISEQTSNNLRFYNQFKKIISSSKTKKVFTTFEGHGHERLFFKAAKVKNPRIQTCGYQHACTFKNQHSLFRSLSKEFDPDEIFLIGEHAKDRFKKVYNQSKLVCAGSSKLLVSNIRERSFDKITILAIPEGMEYEVNFMLDFVQKCSLLHLNLNFRFRLHPLLRSNQQILRRFQSKISKNITLSEISLNEDLIKSQFVLYRGSSAVVEAMHFGVIPLYLKNQYDHAQIDPLYMLQKQTLEKPEELNFLNGANYDDILEIQRANEVLLNYAGQLKTRMSNEFRPI